MFKPFHLVPSTLHFHFYFLVPLSFFLHFSFPFLVKGVVKWYILGWWESRKGIFSYFPSLNLDFYALVSFTRYFHWCYTSPVSFQLFITFYLHFFVALPISFVTIAFQFQIFRVPFVVFKYFLLSDCFNQDYWWRSLVMVIELKRGGEGEGLLSINTIFVINL